MDAFRDLTQEQVLTSVENEGFITTGQVIQLNSFENRVFDIYLEPGKNSAELNNHLICKFYRPNRWSQETILEEHSFTAELFNQGIPVVSPIENSEGITLTHHFDLKMALFKKGLGRLPHEFTKPDLVQIGKMLAQVHNVGAKSKSKHRPIFHPEYVARESLTILNDFVSVEVWNRYEEASLDIFDFLCDTLDSDDFIRIHGDCHRGNLLKKDVAGFTGNPFFLVDFDDFAMGPPAQDFWMLFSSGHDYADELDLILSGYQEFRTFKLVDPNLFNALRGFRIIQYATWIAKRWGDPTFPSLFPQFKDYAYWAEETEIIERIARSL